MKYANPLIVTCPRCKESGVYQLADLRNFREDIESLKTLDDVLLLTTKKLSAPYRSSELEQIVFSVASASGNYAANELKSSMNLRDMLEKTWIFPTTHNHTPYDKLPYNPFDKRW